MLLKENGGSVAETRAAMLKMRREGRSIQEIADITGYSKTRVSQLTSQHTGRGFRRHSTKGCIYTGLRNWLNDNRISMWELMEQMGYTYSGNTSCRIRSCLSGRQEMKKSYIDACIRLSGKTYEELFGEVG